jgi:predicted RNA-binding protein YlxR (DUF448 family)
VLSKKKTSFRTCLGCRQKKPQAELYRFALTEFGTVVCDFMGKYPGRHAYACKTRTCLQGLLNNKKGLARTLRREVLSFDEELQSLFGSE